jgi:TonB family protein
MKAVVIGAALLMGTGAVLRGAQDPLNAARDLYASAAYEDALSTLNKLEGELPPEVDRQAKEYRAFCLYALNRTREADSIVEAIIRQAPLTPLTATDASPRLEQRFLQVRKRLLPSLIRERFRSARAALDQKLFAAAEPDLVQARLMIGEANKLGVDDEALGDLSVLVDGFLQLIQSTQSQPAAAPEPAPAPIAPPVAPVVAPASNPRLYTIGDEGISPPVPLEQRMPVLTQEMKAIARAWQMRGVLSVVIDETGRVVEAAIRPPLTPSFDAMILSTVRQWKYLPAKKDGVPVRYLKMVALVP